MNNYERLQNLSTKRNVKLTVGEVSFPKLDIPAGTMCIFPVNIDGIRLATAQIIAHRDGNIYLEQIKGIPTIIQVGKKVLRNVKPLGLKKPVYKNIYLLSSEEAERLFLEPSTPDNDIIMLKAIKTKESGMSRTISIGVNKVAEEPGDADFEHAATYLIDLPDVRDGLLSISYRGDVARLYANGKLIDDNFYNGRPFLYGLWRLPADCRQLELKILPLQEKMPVYFPKEADTTPGEMVGEVKVIRQVANP